MSKDRPVALLLVALLLVGAAVRLALGGIVGLSVDESYAVVLSRHWALSYYDHPPLFVWIPGAAAWLAGSERQMVVRLPFIVMFMGTTWLIYRLGVFLSGERAGLWAAVTLNLALFFAVNAGSWVLPDGPLLIFSAAATLMLAHAVADPAPRPQQAPGATPVAGKDAPANRTGWWLWFGLFTGLALLSKYHGAFLLAGCALFLLSSPRHRVWLRRPAPYAAVALALVVFLPVLIWNAGHGWASFRFQGGRALPHEDGQGTPLFDTIVGQAAWMLPWLWVPLLGALVRGLRTGPRNPARWLLTCLAAGPIAFFTLLTALGSRGLPHWQAPGYFMLFPLLGSAVADRLARGDRWTARWLWACLLGFVLVVGLIATQVQTGWIGRAMPSLLSKGDPTRDVLAWQALPARLHDWGYPRPGLAIAAATWADTAKAAYALGPRIRVFCVGSDARGFQYQGGQDWLVGRDVLLLASRRGGPEPMVTYAPYFERVAPVGNIPILRGGVEEIAVSVYLGRRLLRPIPQSPPR